MNLAEFEGRAKSVLRMIVGFTFSLHGFQKLLGVLGGLDGKGATVQFFSQLWVAGVLESVGGLFILFGLFTRPVAFLLCGQMAVAYFQAHAPRGFWPLLNGGELAVIYCFAFLYFCVSGPGPLSLDAWLRKKP